MSYVDGDTTPHEPGMRNIVIASLRSMRHLGLCVALPFVAVVAWEGLVRAGAGNAYLTPPPSIILQALLRLAAPGALSRHVLANAGRVVIGFGLALLIGFPVLRRFPCCWVAVAGWAST